MPDTPVFLCRACLHLKLAKRGTHPAILGECTWKPDIAPQWLLDWLEIEDRYGPHRTRFLNGPPVTECNAWAFKPDAEEARFREYPKRRPKGEDE